MVEVVSDTELWRQMRQGDSGAFAALYRRHQAALYRYALLRTGSESAAADLVQEVFIGLMQDQYRFDPLLGSLQFFLFGVIRNLALKYDASQRRFGAPNARSSRGDDEDDEGEEVMCESPTPLQRLLQNEMAEDLRVAIASLSAHYRDVLILFEMEELSYIEIAEICQINVGTVRSRLSRARQALAERLQAWQGEHAKSA